jgi:hypothetical protein
MMHRLHEAMTDAKLGPLGMLNGAVQSDETYYLNTFCGQQHLQRYLTDFQFRYNNRSGLGISDEERTATALKGIEGKRLTCRAPN